MPVQTIVRDFLAVKEAKLLIWGLTILRGESFQGKSSLVAALRAAFTNTFTSTCVHWGADHAEIHVKFPDNKVISVKRTAKGSTEMQFDGQVYSKIGRVVPEPVSEYLNLRQVSLGADTYNLNFYDQFQPPLLLACSHKRLADMLSASGALADFNLLQKALASRKDELKGSFTTLDGLLTSAKAMAGAERAWLEKADPIADDIQREHTALVQVGAHLAAVQQLSTDAVSRAAKQQRLAATKQALEALSALEATRGKSAQLDMLAAGLSHRNKKQQEATLRGLLAGDLGKLETMVVRLYALRGIAADTEAVALRKRVGVQRKEQLEAADAVLQSVQDLEALRARISYVAAIASDMKTRSMLREAISKNSNLLEQDVCPFCGTKTTDNNMMTKEDIQRRRAELEEQLRRDEQEIAVLESRIAESAKLLGLTDPTPEQVAALRADLEQKAAQQEQVVESQLAKLESLMNPQQL